MTICACLSEETIDDCLKVINKTKLDLFEHRIDYLKNFSEKDCLKLSKIYNSNKKIIATCRKTNNGGKFSGSEIERINILLNAIEFGASYVDIEIETQPELIKKIVLKAKEKKCKIIISKHDFEKTPKIKELKKIMLKEKELGADIGKIVCKANSIMDCHNLLELIIEAKKNNLELISFGMGKIGKFSRISSLIYGSPFTFVSINNATAPGQLNLKDVQKILSILKN